MKALLIHQAFVPPNEPGGTRHYELAKYFVDKGNEFTIVASNRSYLTGKRAVESRDIVSRQNIQGIEVYRAYTYPSLHRSFVWRVFSFLSFMLTSIWAALKLGSIDLVMGTSPPIFQAVSAWFVSKLKRKPFLLEVRDLWPEFAIDMGVLTNPFLIKISRWLENFLYTHADHLLVNSPAYRKYLINKGIDKKKISFIPNGVESNMFVPEAKGETVREKYHLNEKFVVTYAGAIGQANDLATLLKAANELGDEENIQFLLVGDGKERENLENMATNMKLNNVTFVGSCPKSEIPLFLAASDACVAILQNISMFSMTYPNKVFDYMAAGRPTILAIDGVIRDVIEKSEGGVFVSPGDYLALAEAVKELSLNPQIAQNMGIRAREYVMEHFERKKQAEAFTKLIGNLIKRIPRNSTAG